jgi:exodeoxyribonuclease VII large subunit
VVSAVGHEQDTPLCDLAADVRASTPTAAARLVVPDFDALVAALERARAALAREARRGVEQHRERLDRNGERLRRAPLLLLERRRATLEQAHAALARDARRGVEQHRERLDRNGERLRRAPLLLVERRRATLEQAAGKLRALSPRATLARGYAIVRREGGLVRSSSGLVPEDLVDVELAEGSFAARVGETRP